ncbi:Uncharacterised protein [uncultured archaeon]|nr:Uncharacterised protein [uncultured archaeon]
MRVFIVIDGQPVHGEIIQCLFCNRDVLIQDCGQVTHTIPLCRDFQTLRLAATFRMMLADPEKPYAPMMS